MSDTSAPAWFVHGIGRVRIGLNAVTGSAVPPSIALLEMAQGARLIQAPYVATQLGIADALDDQRSSTILRNVRTAMADGGRRERTATEYANPLSRAGFQQLRVKPSRHGSSTCPG